MSDQRRPVYGSLDVSRIEAILFDVDGTLSDTDDRMVAWITRMLSPVSWLFKKRNPQRFARRLVMAIDTPGNFLYNMADRLGIDGFLARYYKLLTTKRTIKKVTKDEHWIIPGVHAMLTALATDYSLGIVSARDAESTRAFLTFFDLTSFFKVIVTAQTCQHTKPFPDPVMYAAESLGVAVENCLMVGDTIVDIRSGKTAGAQTVGVLCGFGTANELERSGSDMILSSTSEIQNFL
jgi:HAD superfamily hydrolase (TIGR01549 family)